VRDWGKDLKRISAPVQLSFFKPQARRISLRFRERQLFYLFATMRTTMQCLLLIMIVSIAITKLNAQSNKQFKDKFELDLQPKRYDPPYNFSNKGPANVALTIYQKLISEQIGGGCIYSTSCSRYSRKAIQNHGMIKGMFMTGDRLTRCNQFVAKHIPHSHLDDQGYFTDEPD